ncbi:MAG: hypothetical protein IJW01_04310 [Paludibacteraceae bacterium]|nr:hypothetical protein [Paludibacteraceae bacterium]
MNNKILIIALLMALILPSCMTTRTSVGSYRETEGKQYVYSRGKQCYLFWGLLPLGRTRVATPASGNCEVRTRYNFWDALVSTITGGIFQMQTIRVYAKKQKQQDQETIESEEIKDVELKTE